MKKLFALFFVVLFVFTFNLTPVLATHYASLTAQENLEELRLKRQEKVDKLRQEQQELQQKRQDKRQVVKDQIATKQAQQRQKSVEKVRETFLKILERLNAALNRLDKISEKIATRIDKLKEKGVDTSKAEAALAQAEQKGVAAAAAIKDAEAAILAIDPTSTTVNEAVMKAKDAVGAAKVALKDYHMALVAALRELKAASSLRGVDANGE